MRIASATIIMSSQHSSVETDVRNESLEFWVGDRNAGQGQGQGQDIINISAQAKELFAEQQKVDEAKKVSSTDDEGISDKDKQKIQLLQDFIERLTGKKFKFYLVRFNKQDVQEQAQLKKLSDAAASSNGDQAPQQAGWGLRYHSYQAHTEQESVSFKASGIVKTADGKEINISVELGMSRQFMSEQSIDIRAGDALKDPLVINYGGTAAQLTATKYQFDLDSDGSADNISFVGTGSGFLALDHNGDGIINNGGELFGPNSGNGFADLAQYDADGNNWIDENDPIYNKLRIWTKDEAGNDQLLAIGQVGVGAIYLGNVSTDFSFKDSENKLDGQLRSTGIFLRENGVAGTVQQIDLAV